MSGHFSSLLLFASLVAIVFASNYASDTSELSVESRGPASVGTIHDAKPRLFKPATALKTPEKLNVKLEMVGPKPTSIGDIFVLRGTVSSRENLDSANFTWKLPRGVKLVKGPATGTLRGISANHPGSVELTMRKTGPEDVNVHLKVAANQGGASVSDSSQYKSEK